MLDYFVPYITIGIFYGAIYRFIIRKLMIKEFMKSNMPKELKDHVAVLELRTIGVVEETFLAIFLAFIWPALAVLDILTISVSLLGVLK